jgi:hypothetical protein
MYSQGQSIEPRIGTLSFTHDFANGYPTKETVEKLYDERDFQRACQAYLWALPIADQWWGRPRRLPSNATDCAGRSCP